MAYTNRDTQLAVQLLTVKLVTAPEQAVGDFIADLDFEAIIPTEADRIELTHARLRKEWRLNGSVNLPSAAIGIFDLTGSAAAAGDGLVGFEVNSVTYLSSTDGGNAPAGQTAEEAAQALADSVNGYTYPVVQATVSGAEVILTSIEMGSAVIYYITDKTTDSTMAAASIDDIIGGTDLALTGTIVKGIDGAAFQGSTKA